MILDLTPDMVVTPGWRVIERETRRKMARIAAARAETKRLRQCRAKFVASA